MSNARNVSGWLPNLLGPVQIRDDGAPCVPRGAINFVGFTVADNPDADSVDVGPGADETPDATTGVKGKVQLAGDLGGTAAAPVVATLTGASGEVQVLAPRVRSKGAHADCDALSDEQHVDTSDDTPTELLAIPIPAGGAARVTCDVVGLTQAAEASFFRLARNFVNQGGTMVDGTLDASTPEELGGGPTLAATLTSDGASEAQIIVTGAAATNVRWYVVALSVRILASV